MYKKTIGGVVLACIATLSIALMLFGTRLFPSAHAAPLATQPSSLFALEHAVGVPATSHQTKPTALYAYDCKTEGAKAGNLLLNISEDVVNDAANGQTNYWAQSTWHRTIRMWNVGASSYCAIVTYSKGTFAAFAGQQSPGYVSGKTGGILTGDEVGTFAGSAKLYIHGDLDVSSPKLWPLVGAVNSGTPVDYMCNEAHACPGYVLWINQYFALDELSYTQPQFGFHYIGFDKPSAPDPGTPDGTWDNAYNGNFGDILDIDA